MSECQDDNNALMDSSALSADALWQFSLACYPAVKPVCLQLQSQYQLNINLLMLCAYCQSHGCALDEEQLRALQQGNRQWRQSVIEPYRALRERLKFQVTGADYQALLTIELALEREEQQRLFSALPPLPLNNPEAQANILTLLLLSGVALERLSADELRLLQRLGEPGA